MLSTLQAMALLAAPTTFLKRPIYLYLLNQLNQWIKSLNIFILIRYHARGTRHTHWRSQHWTSLLLLINVSSLIIYISTGAGQNTTKLWHIHIHKYVLMCRYCCPCAAMPGGCMDLRTYSCECCKKLKNEILFILLTAVWRLHEGCMKAAWRPHNPHLYAVCWICI